MKRLPARRPLGGLAHIAGDENNVVVKDGGYVEINLGDWNTAIAISTSCSIVLTVDVSNQFEFCGPHHGNAP